jgi:SAM-dependent methyltransferase
MAWLKAQDEKSTNWVKEQIDILNRKGWYHSIQLPDGRVIEGVQSVDHLKGRIARFPVPENLAGKRVLDIGAWDGWFSFEMERRGAEVVAVDCIDMEKFRIAHELLGSKVDSASSMWTSFAPPLPAASISCSSWGCCTTCDIRCSRSSVFAS